MAKQQIKETVSQDVNKKIALRLEKYLKENK
jgi:hypothetical protein